MNPKRDFALHRATTLAKTDPKEAYSILLASMGRRLDSASRREGNAALRKAGFDGNGRFRRIGEALASAFKVLSRIGIEQDEVLNMGAFMGDSGARTIDLAFSNPDDPFSPEPISNSVLHFSWTELDSGALEVIAYLS